MLHSLRHLVFGLRKSFWKKDTAVITKLWGCNCNAEGWIKEVTDGYTKETM